MRSAIKANGRPKEKETGSAKVTEADASEQVQLEIKDISMVIPQRKKFTLCFNESHLYAKLADGKDVVPGTSFAWSDIGRCCINYSFLSIPMPPLGTRGPDC